MELTFKFIMWLAEFVTLFFIGYFTSSVIENSLETRPREFVPALIASNLLLKYFGNRTINVMCFAASSSKDHNQLQSDIINNVVKILEKEYEYPLQYVNNIYGKDEYWNASDFNLILVEDYASFLVFQENITPARYPFDSYYLIVITKFQHDYQSMLTQLFRVAWKKSWTHLNVLIPYDNNTTTWLMTTYIPFRLGCDTLEQQNIALFTEKNFTLSGPIRSIYPSKFKNFHQCPLNAAIFSIEPFVIIKRSIENVATPEDVDGIDINVLKLVAERLNFSLVFKIPPDGRGAILQNGTTTGIIKMVVNGDANLTLGILGANPDSSKLMSPSTQYLYISTVFAIRPSEDIATPLERLFAPMDFYVWICTFACIVCSIFVLLLTKNLSTKRRHFVIGGRLNRAPILNMWILFLGGASGNPRMRDQRSFGTFARTLVLLWVLLSLVVRGSYQGSLYDFFQSQRLYSPFDTTEKIKLSKCKIITTMGSYSSFLKTFVADLNRYTFYDSSVQSTLLKLHDGQLEGVFFLNEITLQYFNLVHKPYRRLEPTKNRMQGISYVIYFSKNSYLPAVFDYQIQFYQQFGFIDQFTRKYVDVGAHSKRYEHRKPVKLKAINVLGALEICGAMLLFSTIVFILEVMSVRYIGIRRLIEYLTY